MVVEVVVVVDEVVVVELVVVEEVVELVDVEEVVELVDEDVDVDEVVVVEPPPPPCGVHAAASATSVTAATDQPRTLIPRICFGLSIPPGPLWRTTAQHDRRREPGAQLGRPEGSRGQRHSRNEPRAATDDDPAARPRTARRTPPPMSPSGRQALPLPCRSLGRTSHRSDLSCVPTAAQDLDRRSCPEALSRDRRRAGSGPVRAGVAAPPAAASWWFHPRRDSPVRWSPSVRAATTVP